MSSLSTTRGAVYMREYRRRIREGLPTRVVATKRPAVVRKLFREYMRAYRARIAVSKQGAGPIVSDDGKQSA